MPDTVDKQWELDGTLFEAAEKGLAYQAEQLLAKGANPNARDGAKYTPLHSAAVHGSLAVFTLLLKNGADITAKTLRGQTPLALAELNDQTEIIQFCADKKGAGAAPLPLLKPLTLKLPRAGS